jgi:hypothetical protein
MPHWIVFDDCLPLSWHPLSFPFPLRSWVDVVSWWVLVDSWRLRITSPNEWDCPRPCQVCCLPKHPISPRTTSIKTIILYKGIYSACCVVMWSAAMRRRKEEKREHGQVWSDLHQSSFDASYGTDREWTNYDLPHFVAGPKTQTGEMTSVLFHCHTQEGGAAVVDTLRLHGGKERWIRTTPGTYRSRSLLEDAVWI